MVEDYNQQQPQSYQGSYQMPSQVTSDLQENAYHIVRVLTEHDQFLEIIKREMRGEELFQDEKGGTRWVQREKPMFIKIDRLDNPIRRKNMITHRWDYVCNDEAINECLSILKMCGLNPITPLTNITDEEIMADLLEMECKIAAMLCQNRKKWGLAKSEYPIAVGKLKVIIKDARYRAKNATVLKALRTMTTRLEQTLESKREGNQKKILA